VSWTIVVVNLPPVASLDDLPGDFEAGSLGTREEVSAKIRQVVPEVNFSDPTWGVIDGEDWAIEINVGKEIDRVEFVGLRLTGGEGAIHVVDHLLAQLGWRAVDAQSGELYEPQASRAGFDRWRQWRDRVIGEAGSR
jgi:hypothetical protein